MICEERMNIDTVVRAEIESDPEVFMYSGYHIKLTRSHNYRSSYRGASNLFQPLISESYTPAYRSQ